MKKLLSAFTLPQYFMVVVISAASDFGVLYFLRWLYANE